MNIIESNIIFLLSMPRSGSTLLGMMLGGNPEIHCPPEPWIQLAIRDLTAPSLGTLPIDDNALITGVSEFIKSISTEQVDASILNNELQILFSENGEKKSRFAPALYKLALSASGKKFFVDKTPRYYHILDFIDRHYPSAKKIVLLRNPLDIALSYKNSWQVSINELIGQTPTANSVDFAKGLFDLADYSTKRESNVHVISYENLVCEPERVLRQLCNFIGTKFSPQMLAYQDNIYLVEMYRRSSLGDRNLLNSEEKQKINNSSVGKWRQDLSKEDIKSLVHFLGKDIFSRLGYNEVIAQLKGDGIIFPDEDDSKHIRKLTLAKVEKNFSRKNLLLLGSEIIISSSVDSENHSKLFDLLSSKISLQFKSSCAENNGDLILDLVDRYRKLQTTVGDLTSLNAISQIKHIQFELITRTKLLEKTMKELDIVNTELITRTKLLEKTMSELDLANEKIISLKLYKKKFNYIKTTLIVYLKKFNLIRFFKKIKNLIFNDIK